jgi:putative transposase
MAVAQNSRKGLRLRQYDYALPGPYFATLCTANRQNLLAVPAGARLSLTELGWIARDCWSQLPSLLAGVRLDAFVVMPNHVHGLIEILQTPGIGTDARPGTKRGSLSAIIQAYKSRVTRLARQTNVCSGDLWQRGYHDHIVRGECDLEYIREYIVNNPARWHLDRENPSRDGVDPFDEWLELQSSEYSKG